jgi:hypothetical protein
MLRSFRAQDFIQLPPLGEAGTLTLIDELHAVAKATPKVPSSVFAALGRLLDTATELQKHIATRERAGSAADPRARAADRALDDAWGAFQSWLLGWTRLPDKAHPLVTDARDLYAALFPKGLQFLTLDFKDEWSESQQRLDHITAPRDEPDAADPDAAVRRALDATHMGLREYVAHVAATVSRVQSTEHDAFQVAAVLLEPLSMRAGVDSYEAVDDDATLAMSELR